MNLKKDKLSSPPKEHITKLETIFDHNLTEEELKTAAWGFSKEEYKKEFGENQELHHSLIYDLYLMRGDHKIAMEYFNKLSKKSQKGIKELEEEDICCRIPIN